jgi:hypothetical protein
MERINWHEEPVTENHPPKPLGRMLVPTGQSDEEPPKKKRRRQVDDKERRRFIIHMVILAVLLAIIGYGIFDFLYEGPREEIPLPKAVQVDSNSTQ